MKPREYFSPARSRLFRAFPWISAFVSVILLFPFCIPGLHAADVSLAWDRNRDPNVAGYQVYYGFSSRNYSAIVDVGNNTAHVVTGLQNDRRYYFAVTAYDAKRMESGFSREVVWGMDAVPSGNRSAKGGCLIAALAYQGQYADEVMILNHFRDRYLLPHASGRGIIRFYEWISPPLAEMIEKHEMLRPVTRWALSPLVYVVSHPRRTSAILAGIFVMSVGFIIYRRRSRREIPPQPSE
jgi:hypothetical protein